MSLHLRTITADPKCRGLTLWPVGDGSWQANMKTPHGGWICAVGDDADAAVKRLSLMVAYNAPPTPFEQKAQVMAQSDIEDFV